MPIFCSAGIGALVQAACPKFNGPYSMGGDENQNVLGSRSTSTEIARAIAPRKTGSFLGNVVTIAGGQFGCIAIAALAEICYARLLGPAPRGLISLCLMASALGAMLGSLGSEAVVVVWSSKFRGHDRAVWLPATSVWVATGSLLAAGAWGVLYWQLNPAFLKGITPGLALAVLVAIPVTVLFSVMMALLVGEERFSLRSLIALANRIAALLAFLLILAPLGRRAETAVIGYLIGLFVAVGIAGYALQDYLRSAWQVMRARAELMPTILFGVRGQAGTLALFFS